jgi:probable DNA metabolism protein
MYMVTVAQDLSADVAPFRDAARRALRLELPPEAVCFSMGESPGFLLDLADLPDGPRDQAMTVPAGYMNLLKIAICHRAPDRCDLLYAVLWRLKHGEPCLLSRASDPTIAKLENYAKAVRRDIHKTHAFVRFTERDEDDGPVHVAFFSPKHYTIRRAARFFVNRFAQMRWRIETPIGTAAWDTKRLTFSDGIAAPRHQEAPPDDDLWQTYYRTTFNPARLRIQAMRSEMPKYYWRHMPEATQIKNMIRKATAREQAMIAAAPSEVPRFAHAVEQRLSANVSNGMKFAASTPLDVLHDEADACTRCPLYADATQTVFGEGPADARLMLVGEQPGDQEDLAGRPFVGPAGQVLDQALKDAGIARADCYVTNAVKHFKYEPRGKRRIHKKPNAGEVTACRWWLEAEAKAVRPRLIVALGATAALSLFSKPVLVTKARGRFLESPLGRVLVTVHPSYLLRLPPQEKASEHTRFVADLTKAAAAR